MLLKNKKTGEIGTLIVDGAYKFVTNFAVEDDEGNRLGKYSSLAELNSEWEDYEEPKEYWFINNLDGTPMKCELRSCVRDFTEWKEKRKEIGNYFDTREEAELAVRKLKAWKRLKDKGFKFTGFTHKDRGRLDELEIYCQLGERPEDIEDMEDVRLLFGGEE